MTVEERTPKNTNVGEPLNATDVDFGQAILFTLNGSNVGEDDMFGIGKCSGQGTCVRVCACVWVCERACGGVRLHPLMEVSTNPFALPFHPLNSVRES